MDKKAWGLLQEAQQLVADGKLGMSADMEERLSDIAQILVPHTYDKNSMVELLVTAMVIGWIARKREEAVICS